MIRVLHIVGEMNVGGIENFIMNLYRKIDRSKIQFDFLTHTKRKQDYESEIISLGGKIYSVSPRSQGILKNKIELEKFFENHKEYKIVHQHVSSLSYIEPLRVAMKYEVPVRIIHGHSTQETGHKFHNYIHKINQKFIEKIATNYFVASEKVGEWLCKDLEYKIINNGIDTELFKYDGKLRKTIRERYELTDNFVIGHVGRFVYPKNHEFILDIFSAIKKQEPKAVLLLVGDGQLKNLIAQKAKENGVSDDVYFIGSSSKITEHLNAMDVFLFPSHYEGLGIAAVEAQSTGLKCIVSDQLPEEVMITSNIRKLSLNSPKEYWADKILEYKDGYSRKSQTMRIIDRGYDIRVVANQLEKFYKSFFE